MKNYTPLISIIIPVYDAGPRLEAALRSIVQQTYTNWEIIVVDDGSTDEPEQILKHFPIKHFLCQPNQGAAIARNQGLALAAGELIAFLDADDRWPEHKLESQMAHLLAHEAVQIVTGLVQFVFEDAGDRNIRYNFNNTQNQAIHAHLGAGLFRRAVFGQIGIFNETMRFSEDMDWWNRAKENELVINVLKDVGLLLTIHADSLSYGMNMQENGTFQAMKLALDRRRRQGILQVPRLSDYLHDNREG